MGDSIKWLIVWDMLLTCTVLVGIVFIKTLCDIVESHYREEHPEKELEFKVLKKWW